jgi:hypothetical protein
MSAVVAPRAATGGKTTRWGGRRLSLQRMLRAHETFAELRAKHPELLLELLIHQ